jgi:acyl carrier protein
VVLRFDAQNCRTNEGENMYSAQIRDIVAAHGRLLVDVKTLDDESDLYEAGLTSLSTVNLMLALEEHFDVEFLDRMLGRKTFQSIASLSEAITELRGPAPTTARGLDPTPLAGAA